MNSQRTMIHPFMIVVILGCAMIAGLYSVFASSPAASTTEHYLSIMKVKNTWKVVHADDTTRTLVVARKGDKVRWTAHGSDVYFQFMDDKIFGGHTKVLMDGKELTLTIGQLAKNGANPYAVFCLADKEYARGDSPPVIIIE